MVFDLFSKYGRAKKQAESCFNTFIPIFSDSPPEDLGEVLNAAADLKGMASTPEEKILYEKPEIISIEEYYKIAIARDKGRIQAQNSLGYNSPRNQIYVAAGWIWDLSLMACQIKEVKHKGIVMWQHLSKGFPHSNSFNPKEDVPTELWVDLKN